MGMKDKKIWIHRAINQENSEMELLLKERESVNNSNNLAASLIEYVTLDEWRNKV